MIAVAILNLRDNGDRNLCCQADFFERGGPLKVTKEKAAGNRAALLQAAGDPRMRLSRRLGAGHGQTGMTVDVTTFRDFGLPRSRAFTLP
jgi:hypothetical protein